MPIISPITSLTSYTVPVINGTATIPVFVSGTIVAYYTLTATGEITESIQSLLFTKTSYYSLEFDINSEEATHVVFQIQNFSSSEITQPEPVIKEEPIDMALYV